MWSVEEAALEALNRVQAADYFTMESPKLHLTVLLFNKVVQLSACFVQPLLCKKKINIQKSHGRNKFPEKNKVNSVKVQEKQTAVSGRTEHVVLSVQIR